MGLLYMASATAYLILAVEKIDPNLWKSVLAVIHLP